MRVSHVEAKLIRFFEINHLYLRNYTPIVYLPRFHSRTLLVAESVRSNIN